MNLTRQNNFMQTVIIIQLDLKDRTTGLHIAYGISVQKTLAQTGIETQPGPTNKPIYQENTKRKMEVQQLINQQSQAICNSCFWKGQYVHGQSCPMCGNAEQIFQQSNLNFYQICEESLKHGTAEQTRITELWSSEELERELVHFNPHHRKDALRRKINTEQKIDNLHNSNSLETGKLNEIIAHSPHIHSTSSSSHQPQAERYMGIMECNSFLNRTATTGEIPITTQTAIDDNECPDLIALDARFEGLKRENEAKSKGMLPHLAKAIRDNTQEAYLRTKGFDKRGKRLQETHDPRTDEYQNPNGDQRNTKRRTQQEYDHIQPPQQHQGTSEGVNQKFSVNANGKICRKPKTQKLVTNPTNDQLEHSRAQIETHRTENIQHNIHSAQLTDYEPKREDTLPEDSTPSDNRQRYERFETISNDVERYMTEPGYDNVLYCCNGSGRISREAAAGLLPAPDLGHQIKPLHNDSPNQNKIKNANQAMVPKYLMPSQQLQNPKEAARSTLSGITSLRYSCDPSMDVMLTSEMYKGHASPQFPGVINEAADEHPHPNPNQLLHEPDPDHCTSTDTVAQTVVMAQTVIVAQSECETNDSDTKHDDEHPRHDQERKFGSKTPCTEKIEKVKNDRPSQGTIFQGQKLNAIITTAIKHSEEPQRSNFERPVGTKPPRTEKKDFGINEQPHQGTTRQNWKRRLKRCPDIDNTDQSQQKQAKLGIDPTQNRTQTSQASEITSHLSTFDSGSPTFPYDEQAYGYDHHDQPASIDTGEKAADHHNNFRHQSELNSQNIIKDVDLIRPIMHANQKDECEADESTTTHTTTTTAKFVSAMTHISSGVGHCTELGRTGHRGSDTSDLGGQCDERSSEKTHHLAAAGQVDHRGPGQGGLGDQQGDQGWLGCRTTQCIGTPGTATSSAVAIGREPVRVRQKEEGEAFDVSLPTYNFSAKDLGGGSGGGLNIKTIKKPKNQDAPQDIPKKIAKSKCSTYRERQKQI